MSGYGPPSRGAATKVRIARPSTEMSTYSRVRTTRASLRMASLARMATRMSSVLRARPGLDPSEVDTRATPGFKQGKAAAKQAQAALAERLSTLQEQLYAEGRTGGERSVLL